MIEVEEKTYNPIGTSEPYRNNFFDVIPSPPPGFAIVLTSGREQDVPLLVQNGSVPDKRLVRKGGYNQATRVDIRAREIGFDAELLSKNSISKFCATFNMSAKVCEPYQVITDNITNVTAAARSYLMPRLEEMASRYTMEELQELRREILDSFTKVTNLSCGICLMDISVQLRPDQSYIRQQEKIQQLKDKQEYETIRADVADGLSKRYEGPVTQVFAEFASDQITAEEAARRLQDRSAKNFDESMRRYSEFLNVAKRAQEMGVASPEVLEEKTSQLFSMILNAAAPGAASLEAGSKREALYAPPPDQEDET